MDINYTADALNPPTDFEPDNASRRQHYWKTPADPFPYAIGNGGTKDNPTVSQIFAILEYCFEALENDEPLVPDRFHRYVARPQWAYWEERDKLIAFLDAEFAKELTNVYWCVHRGAKNTPDFSRLTFDGRSWLCQSLDRTIAALGEVPPEPPAPPPGHYYYDD